MFPWTHLALLLLTAVQMCKARRCDEFTDLDFGHAIFGSRTRTRLLLYTRENGTCGILMSHTNLSAHPELKLSRPTTFVIHGFRPTGSPPVWLRSITELLLAREDMNLVIVDWNRGATNLNYYKVVKNTHEVAKNLTAFVKKMQERGASMSSIQMIGVSLGAHISGFVGANLNGSIGRITALDPAGPLFRGTPPEERLDAKDAQFVDVLHTDIDALGYREPLGHIDFYPNGGTDQPGCPRTIFARGSYFKCDHQRSVFFYLDSLKRACVSTAFPCSSYQDFLDGNCLSCDQFGASGCPVFGYDVIEWKDALLKLGQTKAFFTTNTVSPFCMTNYRVDMVLWNKDERRGYITVKLHGNGKEAVATINTAAKFEGYRETKLFAQFDKDIQSVNKVSLKFSSGIACAPKYKLRVLRIRLTHADRKERPLCRYDILLEENNEVTFRPIPCEDSNF